MLSSKMGDSDNLVIDDLITQNKLEILPISDIRGFEVGPKQIMYITEAQNLSTDLVKLAIQRCAEGSKIILEGDPMTQVDNYAFEGHGNGLRRVIEVFEGYYDFSHVLLPNIYRSQIADKAEEI
jgi:predicted ribonuclease YlaK